MIIRKTQKCLAIILTLLIMIYLAFPVTVMAHGVIKMTMENGLLAYMENSKRLYAVSGTELTQLTVDTENGTMTPVETVNIGNYIQNERILKMTDIAVSSNGKMALAAQMENGREGKILIFNKEGKYCQSISVALQPETLAFTDDGTELLVSDGKGTVMCLTKDTIKLTTEDELPALQQTLLMEEASKDKRLIQVGKTYTAVFNHGMIKLYTEDNLPEKQLTLLTTYGLAKQNEVETIHRAGALKQQDINAILVDAGNTLAGPYIEEQIKAMNTAMYDLAAVGSEDLQTEPETFLKSIKTAAFPTVASNAFYGGKPVFEASENNGQWVVLEKNNMRIGLFSLSQPDGETAINFVSVDQIAREMIDHLKDNGADVIICLADTDRNTAKALAEDYGQLGLNVILNSGDTDFSLTTEGVLIQSLENNLEKTAITVIDGIVQAEELDAETDIEEYQGSETSLTENTPVVTSEIKDTSDKMEETPNEEKSIYQIGNSGDKTVLSPGAVVSEEIGILLTAPSNHTNPLTGLPLLYGDYLVIGAAIAVMLLCTAAGWLIILEKRQKKEKQTASVQEK